MPADASNPHATGRPIPVAVPTEVIRLTTAATRIAIFSGAGMSAESGIPTFRDTHTGVWSQFDPTELASPQGWARDPALVWGWYRWRAELAAAAVPHAGHIALAELARTYEVAIVTQNVDNLHERAGSRVTSHLHGSLYAPRCSHCGTPALLREPPDPTPAGSTPATFGRVPPPLCVLCGGSTRPGVVWFGENLPADAWGRAETVMQAADLVMVVGTSGVVHPAASLPEMAALAGIPVLEINPAVSALSSLVSYTWHATAALALPALVATLNRRAAERA